MRQLQQLRKIKVKVIKQVASKLFADSTIKIDFVQTEREQTMYTKRIEILLHTIKADTAYITSPENLQYYSGFTGGEAWLVITQNERLLFTDSRYLIQAAEEAPDFTVVDIAKTRSEAYLKEHQPALLRGKESAEDDEPGKIHCPAQRVRDRGKIHFAQEHGNGRKPEIISS